MTRPRSQQLNDPATRYQKYVFRVAPTPGSSFTEIQNDGVNNDYQAFLAASATGSDAGATQDLPAVISGTSDPFFGLSVGNAFSITLPGVNGGAPVSISLNASEFVTLSGVPATTSERIAARINATLSSLGVPVPVASRNPAGGLSLKSANLSGYTVGTSASISISNITPGIITVLGFGLISPVTANGYAKVRGVITQSNDGFGGYVFPYFEDGRRVTQNSPVFKNAGRSVTEVYVGQEVIPRQPIYGRLTKIPGAFLTKKLRVNWVTKALSIPVIRSIQSNFNSIVPGDAFRLVFADIANDKTVDFTTTFIATPATVSDVVTAINNAWQSDQSGRVGTVQGSVKDVFSVKSGDQLLLNLNGTGQFAVTFAGTERTATDIAAAINGAISFSAPGQATAFSLDGKIVIESTSVTGPTSSVEVISSSALRALGISPGKYVGSDVCFADGAEIIIRPPSSASSVGLVSSVGTTINKLGLTGQIPLGTFKQFVMAEIPATWPVSISSLLTTLSPTVAPTGYSSVAFSEFMEAGDIPDDNFTVNNLVNDVTPNDTLSNVYQAGALSSFSPVISDVYGQIPSQYLPASVDTMTIGGSTFTKSTSFSQPWQTAKFLSGQVNLVLEYNDGSASNEKIRDYVAGFPSGSVFGKSVNAKFTSLPGNFVRDDVANDALFVSFDRFGLKIDFSPAGTNPFAFNPPVAGFQKSSVTGSTFEVFTRSGAFREEIREMRLTDSNVSASAPSGYVPLSSSTSADGDSSIRINGIAVASSIIKSLNGRPYVTCGDGTSSFGDFNGATAIYDAVAFMNTNSITTYSLFVKKGFYVKNSPISIVDSNVEIIGESDVTIVNTGSNNTIEVSSSTGDNTLTIRNVKLYNATSGKRAISVISTNGIQLSILNSDIQGDVYTVYGTGVGSHLRIEDCRITSSSSSDTLISVVPNGYDESITIVKNCIIQVNDVNKRIFAFIQRPSGSSGFGPVKFSSCYIYPGPYTSTLNAPTGLYSPDKNTGLLDLEPTTNGRILGGGLFIDSVTYEDCVIDATNTDYCTALQLPHLKVTPTTLPGTTGPYGAIRQLNFSRCSIFLNYNSSGIGVVNPFCTGTGAIEVNVENCSFNMQGVGTGSYSPAWSAWTVNDGVSGEPGFGSGLISGFSTILKRTYAQISFMSKSVNIRNVTVNNLIRKSTWGDVTFKYGHLNVDGLFLNYYQGSAGTGVVPFTRISATEVRNAGGDLSNIWPGWGNVNDGVRNTATIKNVRFGTFDVPAGEYWVSNPGAMFFGFGKYMDIERVISLGGTENGATPTAASGGGGVRIGSTNVTAPPGTITGTTDIKIRNCDIRNHRWGIWYTDTYNSSDDSGGVQISNNYVSRTKDFGILVDAGNYYAFRGVSVNDNVVTEVRATAGFSAAMMITAVPGYSLYVSDKGPIPVSVTGNHVSVSMGVISGSPVPSSYSLISSPISGPSNYCGPAVSFYNNTAVLEFLSTPFPITPGAIAGRVSVISWDGTTYGPIPGWDVDITSTVQPTLGIETSLGPKPSLTPFTTVAAVTAMGIGPFSIQVNALPPGSSGTVATTDSSGNVWTISYTGQTSGPPDYLTGCSGGAGSTVIGSNLYLCFPQNRFYEHKFPMMYNYAVLKNNGEI